MICRLLEFYKESINIRLSIVYIETHTKRSTDAKCRMKWFGTMMSCTDTDLLIGQNFCYVIRMAICKTECKYSKTILARMRSEKTDIRWKVFDFLQCIFDEMFLICFHFFPSTDGFDVLQCAEKTHSADDMWRTWFVSEGKSRRFIS